jgi:RNA-binding motif X-linked protein 2
MNQIRDLQKLIKAERDAKIPYGAGSWHWPYRRSPYIFIKNLDTRLSEGDLLVIFSQFGEIVDLKLSRDNETGEPRGFCWIAYEDPRSKVLAIEEMCGVDILNRQIFVDHASKHQKGQNLTKISTLSSLVMNSTSSGGIKGVQFGHEGVKLTGNLIDDIDDTQFEADGDELIKRRWMIWDYEGFYEDDDDYNISKILYDRLKNGEVLIKNEQNQIVNHNDVQNANKSENNDDNNHVFTLDDLSHVNADDIDSFYDKKTSISTQNPLTQQSQTPQNSDAVLFDFSGGQTFKKENVGGEINTSFAKKGMKLTDIAHSLGYSAQYLPENTSADTIDVLEKLRLNRLRREGKLGLEEENESQNNSKRDKSDDEHRSRSKRSYGDDYKRDRESRRERPSDRDKKYEKYDQSQKYEKTRYNDDKGKIYDRYDDKYYKSSRDERGMDRNDRYEDDYDYRDDSRSGKDNNYDGYDYYKSKSRDGDSNRERDRSYKKEQ